MRGPPLALAAVTVGVVLDVAAGFLVFLFPALLDDVMSFFCCCCTELLDISVGAIHTK